MMFETWFLPGFIGFGLGLAMQHVRMRVAQAASRESGIEDFIYPRVPVGDVELADRIRDWAIGDRPDGQAMLRTSGTPHPNLAEELRDAIVETIGGGGAPPGPAAFLRAQFGSNQRGVVDLGTLPGMASSARTHVLTFSDGAPLRLTEIWRHRDPWLQAIDPVVFAERFKILESDPDGPARVHAAIQTTLRERGLADSEPWV